MINTFCKKPLWECSQTLAAVAQGREPADTVIRDAKLVNVCTAEIQDHIDVAVAAGRIAYVGRAPTTASGKDTQVIDAHGPVYRPRLPGRAHPRGVLHDGRAGRVRACRRAPRHHGHLHGTPTRCATCWASRG